MRDQQDKANRRLGMKLLGVTVLMFGFGYALIPLYDVFCDITGLNGKTGRVSAAAATESKVDESRLITVEFVTSTGGALPWDFRAKVARVEVHPGALTEVMFEAVNHAQYPVVGHAVPSLAPGSAARYFNKTECFCFTQQELAPGETKDMPVRFIVDPKLPENVHVVTLAYTFFEAPETAALNVAAPEPRS